MSWREAVPLVAVVLAELERDAVRSVETVDVHVLYDRRRQHDRGGEDGGHVISVTQLPAGRAVTYQCLCQVKGKVRLKLVTAVMMGGVWRSIVHNLPFVEGQP